jgi:CheY-like chemotaxis protein
MAKKILLVEDSPMNRELVLATLGGAYEIQFAWSIPQARELLAKNTFDLLLFDINVPGGGGELLLREISAAGPRPPVIAVTAMAMAGDRERLLASGFDEYISKPFDTRNFRTLVARLIDLGVKGGVHR